MTKKEIFEEVVSIMANDSATKKDIVGAPPESYRQKIDEDMTDKNFAYLVSSYLASFGVISHVSFFRKNTKPSGFRVRFYENCLYVVIADQSTGLEKGDCITHIDGQTIEEFYQAHKEYFVSKTPERHWIERAYFICQSENVTLQRDQQKLTRKVTPPSEFDSKKESFKHYYVNDTTYYLKMENFTDESTISTLYEEIDPILKSIKNLIIDVRVNHGGSDSLYFPLLKYVFPREQCFSDFITSDASGCMEILYTDRNLKNRLQSFEEYLSNPNLSEESRQMIEEFTRKLRENKDKGYVVYHDDEEFLPDVYGLEESPEHVYVLSDVMCGSSGDNFVSMMSECPKVTVVGRPTMGILDYSNCCTVDFGEYTFQYPTSRSLCIDQGEGMTDKGVQPDYYIPWTPEHLERDVDLEAVLDMISTV